MFQHIRRSTLIFLSIFVPLLSMNVSAATDQKATANKATSNYTEPITGMKFVAIPGGTFTMGNNLVEWAHPEHKVTVKPFLLGRYEVTFEQYAKFCGSTGRQLPPDDGWNLGNRPVVNVSWHDANAFTVWLSEKTGKKFRLPSEAEWEYAARGGAKTKYPWGDQRGKNKANCKECGSKWDDQMTAPVGSFAPNGYGLYDMSGNVYEWCLDARHDSYEGAPADGSAWVENGKFDEMVFRGGSWRRLADDMTVTRRCWSRAESKSNDDGFRVLLEP